MFANLKILTILLLLTMGTSSMKDLSQTSSQATAFYVGTYTDKESEGIYKYSLDDNGKLSLSGLLAREENPSYLAKTVDGKYLLAVNENSDDQGGGGTVASFAITADTLKFINRKKSGGDAPCHITPNPDGQLLVSNYLSGTIALLQIDSEGLLNGPLDISRHQGSGPHDRQESPHAHSAWFSPEGNEIIGVDLGTDELWLYTLEKDGEPLQNTAKVKIPAGSGPRHLAFHPAAPWVYVINELNSTITQLNRSQSGEFELIESVSTLPEGYEGENYTADIRVAPDGRFLYGSNRGHNSLVIYKINQQNGHLSLVGHQETLGDWPRNFVLSPDAKYLLVANQRSNSIVAFKRDGATGKLEFSDKITAPSPVCLVF